MIELVKSSIRSAGVLMNLQKSPRVSLRIVKRSFRRVFSGRNHEITTDWSPALTTCLVRNATAAFKSTNRRRENESGRELKADLPRDNTIFEDARCILSVEVSESKF